jgi:hypothetical protein
VVRRDIQHLDGPPLRLHFVAQPIESGAAKIGQAAFD